MWKVDGGYWRVVPTWLLSSARTARAGFCSNFRTEFEKKDTCSRMNLAAVHAHEHQRAHCPREAQLRRAHQQELPLAQVLHVPSVRAPFEEGQDNVRADVNAHREAQGRPVRAVHVQVGPCADQRIHLRSGVRAQCFGVRVGPVGTGVVV